MEGEQNAGIILMVTESVDGVEKWDMSIRNGVDDSTVKHLFCAEVNFPRRKDVEGR